MESDTDIKLLICSCSNPDISSKISVGFFNDHFHYIQCGNCKTRTIGHWILEEAVDDWKKGVFWNKTD